MGLRWVRENIGAFGGDPTRITLMGHDTGAALVNLLLLAPYSKGTKGGREEAINLFRALWSLSVRAPRIRNIGCAESSRAEALFYKVASPNNRKRKGRARGGGGREGILTRDETTRAF